MKIKKERNENDILEPLKEEWNDFSNIYFEKLFQRMPNICAAVVKAIGEYFDERKI